MPRRWNIPNYPFLVVAAVVVGVGVGVEIIATTRWRIRIDVQPFYKRLNCIKKYFHNITSWDGIVSSRPMPSMMTL